VKKKKVERYEKVCQEEKIGEAIASVSTTRTIEENQNIAKYIP